MSTLALWTRPMRAVTDEPSRRNGASRSPALAAKTSTSASGVDATIYTDSGFNAQQTFSEVPGNHHATVPTHALDDWRALDARLAFLVGRRLHDLA